MFAAGDVISYLEMCQEEGASLQRGMNFRLRSDHSVVLMSLRQGAPYADQIEENGKVLIYEGHDISRTRGGRNPKRTDQPKTLPSGRLTQNGMFFDAAVRTKRGEATAEPVRVYEKIRNGVWAFDGVFALLDAWLENNGRRKVFKFKLELTETSADNTPARGNELPHNRLIPTTVKLAVWKRDGGKCVQCGSRDNLHFDHDLPYSKGGSSLLTENIQLLCARHNLQKHDRII